MRALQKDFQTNVVVLDLKAKTVIVQYMIQVKVRPKSGGWDKAKAASKQGSKKEPPVKPLTDLSLNRTNNRLKCVSCFIKNKTVK